MLLEFFGLVVVIIARLFALLFITMFPIKYYGLFKRKNVYHSSMVALYINLYLGALLFLFSVSLLLAFAGFSNQNVALTAFSSMPIIIFIIIYFVIVIKNHIKYTSYKIIFPVFRHDDIEKETNAMMEKYPDVGYYLAANKSPLLLSIRDKDDDEIETILNELNNNRDVFQDLSGKVADRLRILYPIYLVIALLIVIFNNYLLNLLIYR